MKTTFVWFVLLLVCLTSCAPIESGEITAEVSTVLPVTVIPGATQPPFPTAEPPTAIPPLPSGPSPTGLKYRVLDEFPGFFFCDPDYYPIAVADEMELAGERFPEIQANTEEFQAILSHTGLSGADFTDEEKLLIYREHKRLAAVHFERVGDQYQFQLQTANSNNEGFVISGSIDGNGRIKVEDRQPTFPTCPICLAAHTQIDTPNGPVAVEDLHIGDPVWTMDASGRRISAPVLTVTRVPVPAAHQVAHIVLEDGRELRASPGHPTSDSRQLGDLRVGDKLDGSLVKYAERVPYRQAFTYDLLPSGETGFYWADGILIGSTLK